MANIRVNISFNNEKVSKGYRYSDLTVPVSFKSNGRDFKDNRDIEAIRGGLRNIFSWRRGERVLLPEFGVNLDQYLYEPINDFTATRIREEIKTAIELWEPRVKIDEITVTPTPDQHQYEVSVLMTIPSLETQEQFEYNTIISQNL